MAERVAWRCGFPNCGKITIGPRMGEDDKSLNLGEAAHIIAASSDGPRCDPETTVEYRKSIQNGIWMCRAHAKFIDTDYKEFSVETLKIWKSQAEDQAYKNLQLQDNYQFEDRNTLIAIGFNIFLYGVWKSVSHSVWVFEVSSYLKGNSNELRNYSDNFPSIDDEQKFILVESQGDARVLISPVKITYQEHGKEMLEVSIADKAISSLPTEVGKDLMLGDDGDIVNNGDLKLVSGVDSAIQSISISAGMIYGEEFSDRKCGSFITEYYQKYKDDLSLLSKFVKLEFVRLSLLPRLSSDGEVVEPPLSFIKQVSEVLIKSPELENSRLNIELSLILGDGSKWSDTIKVFVKKT